MRKTKLLLFIAPLLVAMQCYPEEEPCGNWVNTEKKDLIQIENLQTTYNLNDVIWLTATIDRNEEFVEISFSPFDANERFAYWIDLKKESVYNDNNYLFLNEETTIVDKGDALENNFILTKEGNIYQSRTGIRLLETGTYTLSVNLISSYHPERTDCNFTAYSIETDFAEMESGSVTFTVE